MTVDDNRECQHRPRLWRARQVGQAAIPHVRVVERDPEADGLRGGEGPAWVVRMERRRVRPRPLVQRLPPAWRLIAPSYSTVPLASRAAADRVVPDSGAIRAGKVAHQLACAAGTAARQPATTPGTRFHCAIIGPP
jgi:hypothetical protein